MIHRVFYLRKCSIDNTTTYRALSEEKADRHKVYKTPTQKKALTGLFMSLRLNGY